MRERTIQRNLSKQTDIKGGPPQPLAKLTLGLIVLCRSLMRARYCTASVKTNTAGVLSSHCCMIQALSEFRTS